MAANDAFIVTGDRLLVKKLGAGQVLALYADFPANSNTASRITSLNSGDLVGTYIRDERRSFDGSIYFLVKLAVPVRNAAGTLFTQAWVYAPYVYEPPAAKKYFAYNPPSGSVNVRSGPGTSNSVVKVAKHGTYIGTGFGNEKSGFLQLITDDNKVVWVSKSYCSTDTPTTVAPGTVGNPEVGTHPPVGPQQPPADKLIDGAERTASWFDSLDKNTLLLGLGVVVALVAGMVFLGKKKRKRSRR